jgi:hypothetical protein
MKKGKEKKIKHTSRGRGDNGKGTPACSPLSSLLPCFLSHLSPPLTTLLIVKIIKEKT